MAFLSRLNICMCIFMLYAYVYDVYAYVYDVYVFIHVYMYASIYTFVCVVCRWRRALPITE